MSTKAPPEKSMVAIRVSKIYIDRLTDLWQDPSSPIWTFIHAKKLSEQAGSVKKITLKIKEADNIDPVIDVLVDAYLHCPPKYQIKRALASCLQNVSTAQPCVEEVMRRHIGKCLQGPGPLTPLPACRTVIDNCNSLLENFALGERCLQSLLHEAMSFLCDTLTRFYKETRVINTPVPLSEAMHNCHVTIQVLNKLVARSEKYFGGKSGNRADDLFVVLIKCMDMAWRILLDAAFMVDCRASCGMTIPLGFKIMYKEDVVQKVVMDLFPGSEAARLQCAVGGTCPETLPNWAALGEQRLATWPTTRVCVASGCLAMLDAPHLAAEASPGQSLLCGVIGKQLIELIKM